MRRDPIPESFEKVVGVALKVATMHGSVLTLSDLMKLMPTGTTSESLTREFESRPSLSERYSLEGGFVVPRGTSSSAPQEYHERLANSAANVRVARWLSTKVGRSQALSIAVSGSTSYGSASKEDDVDLFCVTKPGTMWIFLTKSLLLTRTSKLLRRSGTPICLSCVVDADYAFKMFSMDRGALFARDALSAEVILGRADYALLLSSAPWMKEYFPRLYSRRTREVIGNTTSTLRASGLTSALDRLLFLLAGTYVKAKAVFHNRILAKRGRFTNSFHARVGRDHLIYESAKYLELRQMYDEIKSSVGRRGEVIQVEQRPSAN